MNKTSSENSAFLSKNAFFNWAALFTLTAIGLHLYLAGSFLDLKLGTTTGSSACNINATFNCDVTSSSSYAALFGIPIALWGAFVNLYNLGLIIIARLRVSSDQTRIERYSLYLSGLIALASLVMGGISTFKLNAFCPFCLGTYALSFLTLACIYKIQTSNGNSQSKLSRLPDDFGALAGEFRPYLIGALLIIPAVWLANSMWSDSKGGREILQLVQNSTQEWQYNSPQTFSDSGLKAPATRTPIMTIVEFADFRCAHCRTAAPNLKAFKESHPDVELIYKAFPLDGTCNAAPGFKGNGDGISCKLAFSVFCSERKQKGWEAYHWIFDRQEKFFGSDTTEVLKTMASDLKMEWSEMEACLAEEDIKNNVQAQAKEGENAKILGTPAIFVNGKKLPGGQFPPVLRAIYDSLKK
ncbi:MAG: DsbA family protein [Pseudobdellovibrionaceae bacterium]